MRILSESEAAWLSVYYPALEPNEDGIEVRGALTLTAAYDAPTNSFAIQRSSDLMPSGVLLSGTFAVVIKDVETADTERCWLPRLYLDHEVYPNSADRHINLDYSACLHGPSDEAAFVRNGYAFLRFLEELCVPFLYAQLHYDRMGRWPWATYSHDAAGVLESYGTNGTPHDLPYSLAHLDNKPSWPVLRARLLSRKRPYGHMACICGSGSPIRSCHAQAWHGLQRMYADLQSTRA